MLKLLIIFLIISCKSLCYCQQSDSTYYYINKNYPSKSLITKIKNSKNPIEKDWFSLLLHLKLKQNDSTLKFIKKLELLDSIPPKYSAKLNFIKGVYFKIVDNDSLRFKNLQTAYKLANKLADTSSILFSLEQLSQTFDYNEDNFYNKSYLNLLSQKAQLYNKEEFKIKHHYLLANYYLFREKNKEALTNYKKALSFNFNVYDSVLIPSIFNNIGALYTDNIEKPDSALYYFKKQSVFLNTHTKYASKYAIFLNFINIGSAYNKLNQNKEAKLYYQKADSIKLKKFRLSNKSYIKESLAHINYKTKNYKEAFDYLYEYNNLSDSLNKKEHRKSIARIKEQYDNEKLRADNLESESKRKQNLNLLIAALGFILFGSITAFLIQKSTKRKQKLAEQDKEIERQKVINLLKEQELLSIDAMIEGQEKERQRIANDLHDDLGGLMATVKLHFNVLKDKQTPELFDKTNTLLDTAYNKIRAIAHAKNSGVIAKQGLLKAIQNMANKISISNTIVINVVDYGLEDRLENSLELTLFRIIQELITNVIKHANATEATIHLTNHEDTLNIMIEDNGKGFNPKQITTKNEGMGISSIDTRVEHLNGSLTIESEINKGTTIIIDIPIMIRLAIAEDHQSLIDGIKLLLEYEDDITIVGIANDGEALLEIVEKKQPNVILTDIRMPKLDGIEATKQIKQKHPKIKVLAFTMFDQTEAIQQMIHAGASGYILKNSSLKEVHTAILTVYKGERYFDANINTNILDSSPTNKTKGLLTKRQIEILELIAQGKTSRQIADILFIGIYTVDTHRKNMVRILDLKGKGELMRYALEKKYDF